MSAGLSRRRFLALVLGAAAAFAAASYAVLKLRRRDPTDIVVAVLKRRVGYLQVDPASFRVFAEEYVQFRRRFKRQLAWLSLLALPLTYVSPYRWLPMGHPLRRLEDNVVSQYLLSTDFFHYGADESRPVKYVLFYDPPRAGCRNPFARSGGKA